MKTPAFFLALALVAVGCTPQSTEEATPDATAAESMETASPAGPMNANLASEEALAGHEGIGTELAAAIVAGRPYADATALNRVLGAAGVGDAEAVFSAVWVPLNLNTATREEILLTPGIGERMAHEFEEYRPYVSMAQFRREMAKYVDDAEVERMAQYVYVPIDLNTATAEEILAIPGVGERMKHEFEEYRPYTSMEQFRREIGKYVDDVELERLARYVEIRN